jgi:hypothetical protein
MSELHMQRHLFHPHGQVGHFKADTDAGRPVARVLRARWVCSRVTLRRGDVNSSELEALQQKLGFGRND